MTRYNRLLVSLLPLVSLFTPSAYAAVAASSKTLNAPSVIPQIWKQLGPALNTLSLTVTFVFSPTDSDALEKRMTEISNSGLPWLSQEEVASYVAPTAEAKSTVEAAIKAIGATGLSYSAIGDKLTVTMSVVQASEFFSAKFFEYAVDGLKGSQFRTLEYTIPASIASYVHDVYPIANFAEFKHVARKSSKRRLLEETSLDERSGGAPASCNPDSVTSACIRSLYGFDTYQPQSAKDKTPQLAIMGYIEQYYSPIDLQAYLKKYRPDAADAILPKYTIQTKNAHGGFNILLDPGVEAALDTQTAAGIIYPLPATFYEFGTSTTPGDIFQLTCQYFLDEVKPQDRPSVITISYGSLESQMSASQAQTMCSSCQQLTAQGVTIVVSSGDDGVAGQDGTTCPAFVPTYPGGCPYILSVGATQNFAPEAMVDTSLAGFYSGAGFSNYFSTPAYQQSVVSSYVNGPAASQKPFFNNGGRAFPDVSAQGSLQNVIVGPQGYLVGGTSASAPIFASGLTLLNDLLKKANKPTVGWAQPKFYAHADKFTDVTSGGSLACGTTNDGLPAAGGWDASAGLGTPSLPKLREIYGV